MDKIDIALKKATSKLNRAKNSFMGKHGELRDENSFNYSAGNILTSLENFYYNFSDKMYLIDQALKSGAQNYFSKTKGNFSATDMGQLKDVDIVDIAIGITLRSSSITYVAAERPMDSISQVWPFQSLVAMNTAGGFTANDTVVSPLQPISAGVNLGRYSAQNTYTGAIPATDAAATASISASAPLVKGETKVVKISDGTLVAFSDPKSQAGQPGQTMIEKLVILDGTVITSGTVNLSTGAVTLVAGGAILADTYQVISYYDRPGESTTGAHTLRLKPSVKTVDLIATENRVILETPIEFLAQANKQLRKNKNYGLAVDFGKRSIDQVLALYTQYVDSEIIRQLWAGVVKTSPIVLDLSSYSTQDFKAFSVTKDNLILSFVNEMTSKFLAQTGKPVTCLVVDEIAGRMLRNDSTNFIADVGFNQVNDGLIGYYVGIPVVRNRVLNGVQSTGSVVNGTVIAVHKSLDGELAAVATGNYLPPYTTMSAINPINMSELSQALFSMTAFKSIVPEFSMLGKIIAYDTTMA